MARKQVAAINYPAKSKPEVQRVTELLEVLGFSVDTTIDFTGTKPNKIIRVEFDIFVDP